MLYKVLYTKQHIIKKYFYSLIYKVILIRHLLCLYLVIKFFNKIIIYCCEAQVLVFFLNKSKKVGWVLVTKHHMCVGTLALIFIIKYICFNLCYFNCFFLFYFLCRCKKIYNIRQSLM